MCAQHYNYMADSIMVSFVMVNMAPWGLVDQIVCRDQDQDETKCVYTYICVRHVSSILDLLTCILLACETVAYCSVGGAYGTFTKYNFRHYYACWPIPGKTIGQSSYVFHHLLRSCHTGFHLPQRSGCPTVVLINTHIQFVAQVVNDQLRVQTR